MKSLYKKFTLAVERHNDCEEYKIRMLITNEYKTIFRIFLFTYEDENELVITFNSKTLEDKWKTYI
jgi:hypothetical protein